MYLFDSFEGLPPPGERDGRLAHERYQKGWCAGSEAEVLKLFDRLRISRARLHVVAGWFSDSLRSVSTGDIALLHIDADWYESVKLCLSHFYDLVQPGGFVVLDDYGRWEGCTRAANEFIAERALPIALDPKSPEGHFFRKPADLHRPFA